LCLHNAAREHIFFSVVAVDFVAPCTAITIFDKVGVWRVRKTESLPLR
jgi:hypothetical protein